MSPASAREALLAAIADEGIGAIPGLLRDWAVEDAVNEWPQSGERIRGVANIERLYATYESATGTSPHFTLGEVRGENPLVIEGTIDYGDGVPVRYVGIAEFRGSKVARMTEYFANPFEAPAWRAELVERMEPVTA
ncbi:MAG TPA: hypothetical protein VFK54_04390 [Candidatus Limnocylindrales bacterium]|nr:hypothetical protein [Candidatus Limnocylindrales bacterium]